MRSLLIRFIVPFAAILAGQYFLPDYFAPTDLTTAAIFALALAIVNAVVGPILRLLALPITCLTLGLFHVVINAICFAIAAAITGVPVAGILGPIIGAVLVSAIGLLLSMFVKEEK
jgi:putative membrane protein